MSQGLNSDCLQIIFSNLKEIPTIYSCSLVNKQWNEIAIPYLWENPFRYLNWVAIDSNVLENFSSVKNISDSKDPLKGNVMKESTVTFRRYENLLNSYLYFMEDNDKKKEIFVNPLNKSPLYNYSTYLKCLDIDRIINTIKNWSSDIKVEPILINLLYIFMKYSKNVIKLCFDPKFQDNNIIILSSFTYLNDNYNILFKEFLSNIKEFECSATYYSFQQCFDIYPSNNIFKFLFTIITNIKSFNMNIPGSFILLDNKFDESLNELSNFINSQHSINKLNLFFGLSFLSNNDIIFNLFKKFFINLEYLELEFENTFNLELKNEKFIKLKYLKFNSFILTKSLIYIINNSVNDNNNYYDNNNGGLEYISIETWQTILKDYSSLNIKKFELFGWWNLLPENIKDFIDYKKSLKCYFKLYIDNDLSDGFSLLSSYFKDEILLLPFSSHIPD
ncbi:18789_t:CDS:2 [Rhizophagus irregularis]|nr:18789_t:CDS:2 [Rhizophagus irregularis]